jgi:ribosomal protein L37AE/L43A
MEQSAADYEWWQTIVITRSKGQVWTALVEIRARINHGRWVADCHYCKKGMLTRPDWGTACCAQCGARYAAGFVKFPEDPRIEQLIKLRPDPTTQNWDDKQTARDLELENEELQLCT